MILTEWSEFNQMDMEKVASSMRNLNLIDSRNIFNRAEMENLGFTYIGMGT